jgi:hypothetical protein
MRSRLIRGDADITLKLGWKKMVRWVWRWITQLAANGTAKGAERVDVKGWPLLAGGKVIGTIFDKGRSISLKPDIKMEFLQSRLEQPRQERQQKAKGKRVTG